MGSSSRQLATECIEWELAIEGDPPGIRQEITRLANPAKPQRLNPAETVESEAVVELSNVDVLRF
jgi:hypothetical protein